MRRWNGWGDEANKMELPATLYIRPCSYRRTAYILGGVGNRLKKINYFKVIIKK